MQVGNHHQNITEMKNILLTAVAAMFIFYSCKYDDSYLDVEYLKPRAYFASPTSYTRTVVPGEGLRFGIGPAMAGVAENKQDRRVDMIIVKQERTISSTRNLLPDDYYNSSQLGGNISVIIPKGKFFAMFNVELDSIKFLQDPNSMVGRNPLYALPVKIIDTSLDSISAEKDSVLIAIQYQASFDGWYLYESKIEREHAGKMIPGNITTEGYRQESDAVTWRLTTQGPFTVRAVAGSSNFSAGLTFDLTVGPDKSVTYKQVEGHPLVEAIEGKINVYDSKTRDFQLNYKYVKPNNNDTVYHVSNKFIFRNRIIDGVMQTREYLSHFNK